MKIITESSNKNTKDIDIVSTLEIVRKINKEDEIVARAVKKEADFLKGVSYIILGRELQED